LRPISGLALRSFVVRNAGAIVPAILTALILGRHVDFVPIWDGRAYADALTAAVRGPFNLLNFNVFAHPSMLFMLWSGLGQFIDPGNAMLLNLSQIVLAVGAVVAFASIARRLMPAPGDVAERFLVTALFAVYPIVLASEQNLNPDTGVLAAFLAYLALLFARRYFWAMLAAVFMVSSKESGVLLYPIATAVFFLVDLRKERWGARVRHVLERTYFFAPLFFYGAVTLAGSLSGRNVLWKKPGGNGNLLRQFLLPTIDEVTHSAYSTGIWIINFNWVLTAVIIAALLKLVFDILRHRRKLPEGIDPAAAGILGLIFLAAVYALTRFPTYTNLRYLLPVYPLFLFVFAVALRSVAGARSIRLGGLAIVFALLLVSVFRTVDPVSKAMYGTFPFGKHPLLKMTSLTRECCGYGRDQLGYNLEYVHFGTIQNRVFEAVRPTNATTFVFDGMVDWFIHGQLDSRTYRRTLRYDDPILPRYRKTLLCLASHTPATKIYYLAYPNADNTTDFRALAGDYTVDEFDRVSEGGYELMIALMSRRRPSIMKP